jgi:ABC-type Na+ transport system ATPase subunit NatA
VIKIDNLSKSYTKSGVKAVDNLNLHVKPGEIFGFIGPNGAGKTTTIKMIVGLLNPDEAGYAKHLRFLIDNGINKENATLVVTGSTGECGAMSTDERKYILDMVLETVDDELPIIAGCNSTNIYEAIELSQYA